MDPMLTPQRRRPGPQYLPERAGGSQPTGGGAGMFQSLMDPRGSGYAGGPNPLGAPTPAGPTSAWSNAPIPGAAPDKWQLANARTGRANLQHALTSPDDKTRLAAIASQGGGPAYAFSGELGAGQGQLPAGTAFGAAHSAGGYGFGNVNAVPGGGGYGFNSSYGPKGPAMTSGGAAIGTAPGGFAGAGPGAGGAGGVGATAQQYLDQANQANSTRYNQLLGMAGKLSDAQTQREQRRQQFQLSRVDQQMISSGLGNSTVLPNMERGVMDDSALRQNEIGDQGLRTAMGIVERRTDRGPDLNLLSSLAMRPGANGGYGGGPQFVGGGGGGRSGGGGGNAGLSNMMAGVNDNGGTSADTTSGGGPAAQASAQQWRQFQDWLAGQRGAAVGQQAGDQLAQQMGWNGSSPPAAADGGGGGGGSASTISTLTDLMNQGLGLDRYKRLLFNLDGQPAAAGAY